VELIYVFRKRLLISTTVFSGGVGVPAATFAWTLFCGGGACRSGNE